MAAPGGATLAFRCIGRGPFGPRRQERRMSEQHAETARTGETDPAMPLRVPAMVMKDVPSNASAAGREMLRTDAGEVRAANVAMEQSGAEAIVAERLSMQNSGAKSIEAKSAQI